MTETAKAVIDRLQYEAGYATGGEVDRLVFSGLDVHEMLNEIEQAIDTDKLSVEKLQEQLNTAKKALTEAIGDIEQLNGSDDTIKYYKQALAEIGGDDED
jgi:outer membrane protein TolC